MPQKLTASLPADMDLDAGYVIRFAAISAASGNPISGVTVSEASLLVSQVAGTPSQLAFEAFVPLLLPLPSDASGSG